MHHKKTSIQEVRSKIKTGKIKLPIMAQFTTSGAEIIIIGVQHVRELPNPLIPTIESMLSAFHKKHPNSVVIAENACLNVDHSSLESSLKKNGEVGAMHWFAHKLGLPVICPEPPYPEVLRKLVQYFEPEAVAYTMLRIAVGPKVNKNSTSEVEEALDRQLQYWSRDEIQSAIHFRPTKEWFVQYHTHGKLNQWLNNPSFWQKKDNLFSTEIMNQMVNIRDESIIAEIVRIWSLGQSIFMVYGGTHVLNLLPKLEKLTGTKAREVAL